MYALAINVRCTAINSTRLVLGVFLCTPLYFLGLQQLFFALNVGILMCCSSVTIGCLL
jgi:hypothetical protein